MSSNSNVVGVVLAGGEGRRLRPLTYYFQKCMIPIGNHQKPLLEYILVHMKRHGIVDLKLLVGYKHEQIVNYFNDGSRFGVKTDYFLDDPSLGGSGGALLNATIKGAFVDADGLLVYYGDILSNIDLNEMIGQHFDSGSVATLAVTNGFNIPVGVAEIEGRSVWGWAEKPKIEIFAGIGIVALSPVALVALKELSANREKMDLMGDLVPFLLERGERVEAYITDAFWYDLGSTEKYEKIDNGLIDKMFNISN
ncbi:MAG: nucleotidyltransferase family protein [Candidatus Hodarchaeota archaeon]